MSAVPSDGHRSVRERLRRRAVTVPALVVVAGVLTLSTPVWLPVALVADGVRGRFRFPIARLLAFGVCWTWIEIAGVTRAGATFLLGRAHHAPTQYALMKWWAGVLMSALRRTVGFAPRVEGIEALAGGNAIVLARHASLADSLFSAWAIRCQADLWPRYVLKRELLSDPCLDVVGLRVPNHFLDREAPDGSVELAALRALATGVGPGEVAVIFPRGHAGQRPQADPGTREDRRARPRTRRSARRAAQVAATQAGRFVRARGRCTRRRPRARVAHRVRRARQLRRHPRSARRAAATGPHRVPAGVTRRGPRR